jgi:hypothetical protein
VLRGVSDFNKYFHNEREEGAADKPLPARKEKYVFLVNCGVLNERHGLFCFFPAAMQCNGFCFVLFIFPPR